MVVMASGKKLVLEDHDFDQRELSPLLKPNKYYTDTWIKSKIISPWNPTCNSA